MPPEFPPTFNTLDRLYLDRSIEKLFAQMEYLVKNPGRHEEQFQLKFDSTTSITTLDKLCSAFSLSDIECQILLLCVAWELDLGIRSKYSQLQNNSSINYPTFDLIQRILPKFSLHSIYPSSPLLRWELVTLVEGKSPLDSQIKIDERILRYLMGDETLDLLIKGRIKPLSVSISSYISCTLREDSRRLAEIISKYPDDSLIQFCSKTKRDKREAALEVSSILKRQLYILSALNMPTDTDILERYLFLWLRQTYLSPSLLLLDCDNIHKVEFISPSLISLSFFLDNIKTPLLISSIQNDLIIDCQQRVMRYI